MVDWNPCHLVAGTALPVKLPRRKRTGYQSKIFLTPRGAGNNSRPPLAELTTPPQADGVSIGDFLSATRGGKQVSSASGGLNILGLFGTERELMFNKLMAAQARKNLKLLREKSPLVHCITNSVVMNFTANTLLACGVHAVMAYAEEEVEEVVTNASALLLNIGTLTLSRFDSMRKAGKRANQQQIPVALDPVGTGSTKLRTRCSRKILKDISFAAIRGNASEILSLSNETLNTKGVESCHSVEQAAAAAQSLAREFKTIVAITGEVDLITDGEHTSRVFNGDKLMRNVTGMGCAATAVIAAFLAVDSNPFSAVTTGLAFFGLAGERAAGVSKGPGSFQVAMIDTLYTLGETELEEGARIQV